MFGRATIRLGIGPRSSYCWFTVGDGGAETTALREAVLVDSGHVAGVAAHLGEVEVRPAGRRLVRRVDVDADTVHVDDAELQTLLDRLRFPVPRRPGRPLVLRHRPLVLHARHACQQTLHGITQLRYEHG